MDADLGAALLLILVPIAFNLAFFELGRAFDYPNILRKEPDEILRRFAAGGAGLILRWEALLLSALAMLPLVALLAVALGAPLALTVGSVVVGSAAALVQALGLVRWPFAVPELARRYVAADGPGAEGIRRSVEVTFATLHRLLGVGIGEHLGYLLTGVDATRRVFGRLDRGAPRVARPHRDSDRDCAAGGNAGVRRAERGAWVAVGRHDRPNRLHRVVAVVDGAGYRSARCVS